MTGKKRGLGRGLDALLGARPGTAPVATGGEPAPAPAAPSGQTLRQLPVEVIQRGRFQPRRDFEPESLQELADSIRAQGVMQPIVVRPISDSRYEIIAGERRWRATQLAGLAEIPVVVRDVPDETAMALGLIENIQREDLNPIEEAAALQRLQQEFGLTQQEVAEAVGKSRPTVANLIRLMSLEDDVRKLVEHGDLEMGHARALLALPGGEQQRAARIVVTRALTVRQTEALVRKIQSGETPVAAARALDPDIRRLQDDLAQRLGAKVEIQHGTRGSGKLILSYHSLDELDGILGHIK